jgi:hypothetical protein
MSQLAFEAGTRFSRLRKPRRPGAMRALGLSFLGLKGRVSMTRSTGFGLFAMIAALIAYVASLSLLSS